ncbi:DUF4489 domain-containing protein [Clostridium oryzae]|uniref:Uncharacterized protein n=1 Tax=Clostridium oryzae TaxID=1450648 RepID=A0A1V4IU34_9CLOT|nr:DUF4489 domain-containing protein [Clostridium oryzae]OPJ63551.1 hypothetical protein CLORY_10590 [Clostridium oryzae]
MNLLSANNKYPVDPCVKEHAEDCWGCKDNRVLLKYSQPRSATLPANSPANSTVTLTTLNLFTKCICDPTIKLDFSTNIIIPAIASGTGAPTPGPLPLSLQVYRLTDGPVEKIPVDGAWTFTPITRTDGAQAFIISFSVFDTDLCLDHHVYSVELTTTTALPGIAIYANHSTLSALVVGEPARRR